MNPKILRISLIAALAGFLFGLRYSCYFRCRKKITTIMELLGSFSRNDSNRHGLIWNRHRSDFRWNTPNKIGRKKYPNLDRCPLFHLRHRFCFLPMTPLPSEYLGLLEVWA